MTVLKIAMMKDGEHLLRNDAQLTADMMTISSIRARVFILMPRTLLCMGLKTDIRAAM